MEIKIRHALLEDSKALEEFLVFNNGEDNRKLAQEYIACMFSNDYRRPFFFIALDEDLIIGAAAFSQELFTTGTWGISWVSVHHNYRQKGIGEKLVTACLNAIEERITKPASVILGTYPNKTGLYDKMGFVKMALDVDGGHFMVKPIKPESK